MECIGKLWQKPYEASDWPQGYHILILNIFFSNFRQVRVAFQRFAQPNEVNITGMLASDKLIPYLFLEAKSDPV
jgi:hypothetical protein